MNEPLPKLIIGCDHAGFLLKEKIKEFLTFNFPSYSLEDAGVFDENSVDYPDVAKLVGEKVSQDYSMGILLCGTGIGVSIAANKVVGIRAALVFNSTMARLAKAHNNANILCLGARVIGSEVAFDCVKAWLTTPFAGERHQLRIDKITELEANKEPNA